MFSAAAVATIILGVTSLLFFMGIWTDLGDKKWYRRLAGVVHAFAIMSIAVGLVSEAEGLSGFVQFECCAFLIIQYCLMV